MALAENLDSRLLSGQAEESEAEKNMNNKNQIAIFQGKNIRKTIFNNEWWFVVEDVILALTNSSNVKDYINKMRLRDEELSKGYGQIVHTLRAENSKGLPKLKADAKAGGEIAGGARISLEKRLGRSVVTKDNFKNSLRKKLR